MATKGKKFKVDDEIITSIRSWAFKTIPTTGNKLVEIRFDNYITWNGYFTKKAMENTMATLKVMGFKGANVQDLANPDSLVTDVEYGAVIGEIREYNGKFYYNAKFINSTRIKGFDESSKELMDDFDIDTRAYIEDAEDLSPAANSEGSHFTADDIPF